MTNATVCPICAGPLEERDVAPCFDCGHLPRELEEAAAGEHTYAEFEMFGGLRLVLCDFCQADFSSYDPTMFGLPRGTRVGIGRMTFIRDVTDLRPVRDKVCPACNHRLAFLSFMVAARNKHAA